MRPKAIFLFVLFGLLLLAHPVIAQSDLSTIRGTVFDQSGGVAPGVEITLEETQTNIVARAVLTDDNGNYEIPYLKRGTYRLSAVLTGFKKFVAEDIFLESSQIRRIDVKLEVGEPAVEVTVRGEAAVIQKDDAKIAAGFGEQRYTETPLVGNWFDPSLVLTTLPHVQSPMGGYGLIFAGQGSSQIQEGMDGVTEDGAVNQINNMEDVEELKAVTVNNSAEFSRVGYFNLVTKSGANDFHGRVYFYHENSALAARRFFDPEKPKEKFHTLGVQASGPIIKDKTFFYAAWNAMRIPSHYFFSTHVPTVKMRSGDFSQLLPDIQLKDPLTGEPFAGNIIPANRLNQTTLKAQELYMPQPNMGAPGALIQNYGFMHDYPFDAYRMDYFTQRIDHQFSKSNTIYGRLATRYTPYVLPRSFPGLAWTRIRNHNALVLSDTHVFSPTLVNNLRFGWLRDKVSDGEEVDGFTPLKGDEAVAALGIQGVNPKGWSAMGFPAMDITGYPSLSVQAGGLIQNDRNLSYADSVTWSVGKHVLKLGGELKTFRNFDGTVPEGTFGSFSFNGSMTGYGYADFLLGLPYSSRRLDPFSDRVRRSSEFGVFVSDTFKATSNLTLDYGLRWDYFGEPNYEDGLQYNWDKSTGNVIVTPEGMSSVSPLYPRQLINVVTGDPYLTPEKGNFAPRIGFAYRIGDRTVLRGAYGIFTETLGRFARAQGGGPFQLSETFYNQITDGQPLFAFPNPFPAGSGLIASQSVSGFDPEASNGYIQQFNVTAERQVRDVGFRLSYVGSRSRGLNYGLSLNKPQPSLTPFSASRRPWPQFVGVSFAQSDGESNYDSFTLQAQRKVGKLTFDAHWTWAHGMSNYLNLENPYDHLHWNRDAYIPNHRFVLNALWQLPFGRNERFLSQVPAAVDHVLGGWQLTWLSYLQTGQFFSPSFSGSDPSNTNSYGGRPDRIADGNYPPDSRNLEDWFDVSAFKVPDAGRFGNAGVNILEGPGLNVHHLSISKYFKMTEKLRLQVMAAFSNIFNHPNFYFPDSNISVPGAGVVTSDIDVWAVEKGANRRTEIRVRFEW